MRPTSSHPDEIHYPSSDGQPVAENSWQWKAMHHAFAMLDAHYASRADVYVIGDLLIYYEEGDPAKSVAPDVFVVFGAAKHERMNYRLWEEPKAPDFVLEVASPGTWKEDRGPKRALYEQLGAGRPRSERSGRPWHGRKKPGTEPGSRPFCVKWASIPTRDFRWE